MVESNDKMDLYIPYEYEIIKVFFSIHASFKKLDVCNSSASSMCLNACDDCNRQH